MYKYVLTFINSSCLTTRNKYRYLTANRYIYIYNIKALLWFFPTLTFMIYILCYIRNLLNVLHTTVIE